MARQVHTPSPSRSPGELAAGAAESGASSGCLLELIPKRGIALAQPFDRLFGFGCGVKDRGFVGAKDLGLSRGGDNAKERGVGAQFP